MGAVNWVQTLRSLLPPQAEEQFELSCLRKGAEKVGGGQAGEKGP